MPRSPPEEEINTLTQDAAIPALPLLAISNKKLELMHKFMSELGLSPVARSRVATTRDIGPKPWEFTGEEDDEIERKFFS